MVFDFRFLFWVVAGIHPPRDLRRFSAGVATGCVWTLALSLTAATPTGAAGGASADPALDAAILDEMRRGGIPSLSAAIVSGGEIVWHGAYGLRDVERELETDTDTVYLLSSISKVFVAVAVMQLYEKGKIDLDADINRYLPFAIRHPEYPDVAITARHLLTHRAGLANPTGAESPSIYEALPEDSLAVLTELVRATLTPAGSESSPLFWKPFKPGSTILSSNMGVTVLACLVETVAGEPFAVYAQRNIFEPLAMNTAGYRLRDIAGDNLATPYAASMQPFPPFNLKVYPAGMLRASVPDLALFVTAVMVGGGPLLEPETNALMLEVRYPDAGLAFQSGLALMWRAYGGGTWLGHTGGGSAGVTASMDFHRDRGVGVIILCNAPRRFSVMPGGKIYELLHREAMQQTDS